MPVYSLSLLRPAILALVLASIAITGCVQRTAPPLPEDALSACMPVACPSGAALRARYAGPVNSWPRPQTAANTAFAEMAALNPVSSQAAERVALGEALFFDPRLSASGQVSCATCHAPELAFTDQQRTSTGHALQPGKRNAPTVLDKGAQTGFMWDGAAGDLERQALMPIVNPVEMANTHEAAAAAVQADTDYARRFLALTGRDEITIEDIASALSAYQQSLHVTTRFDLFLSGKTDLFTDQEIFGLHIFRTKARCMTCHSGPRLTDDKFHNIGLHYYGRKYEDLGRYALTGETADAGAFRTPSLRHISKTAPYMHNGLFPHLRGIVNFYNHGGARPQPRPEFAGDPLFPETSPLLVELGLTEAEKAALLAYLETL